MGYTHYFEQKKAIPNEKWDELKKDVEIILTHIQNELNVKLESNDDNPKLINKNRINFNGDSSQDLDYETFYIDKNNQSFNFCKTQYRPYDLAVCSVLLLLHHHAPDFHDISSDGDFNDWKEAMTLNASVFNKAYELPHSISNNDDDYVAFIDSLKKSTLSNQKTSIKSKL